MREWPPSVRGVMCWSGSYPHVRTTVHISLHLVLQWLYISSWKSAIVRVFQHRNWRVLQIRALFIFLESRLCNIDLHTTIIIFFNMGSWVGIYEHKKMVGVLFCEARNTVMVLTVELSFLFSSICLSFPDILQQVCHFYIFLKWCNYV